jgi:hypothetical protein
VTYRFRKYPLMSEVIDSHIISVDVKVITIKYLLEWLDMVTSINLFDSCMDATLKMLPLLWWNTNI